MSGCLPLQRRGQGRRADEWSSLGRPLVGKSVKTVTHILFKKIKPNEIEISGAPSQWQIQDFPGAANS